VLYVVCVYGVYVVSVYGVYVVCVCVCVCVCVVSVSVCVLKSSTVICKLLTNSSRTVATQEKCSDVPYVVQNIRAVHALKKFPLLDGIQWLVAVLTRLVY